MKNVKLLVLLLAAMMLLAGCGNVSTKVSNPKEVLIKVGDTKITKGDLYEALKDSDKAYTVIDMAGKLIVDAEIETTDEITKAAEEELASYKEQLGEDFQKALDTYGYKDEADLLNAIITTQKTKALDKKYYDENRDAILEKYAPVKAKMIYIEVGDGTAAEAEAKAVEAVNAIKAGESFEAVSDTYSSKNTLAVESLYTREDDSLDYNVLQYFVTCSFPAVSDPILSKDNKGYYVVQVTVTNVSQLEEEFVEKLYADEDFGNEVDAYFFAKHNFTIYDVDINAFVKTNFPSYLPSSK